MRVCGSVQAARRLVKLPSRKCYDASYEIASRPSGMVASVSQWEESPWSCGLVWCPSCKLPMWWKGGSPFLLATGTSRPRALPGYSPCYTPRRESLALAYITASLASSATFEAAGYFSPQRAA